MSLVNKQRTTDYFYTRSYFDDILLKKQCFFSYQGKPQGKKFLNENLKIHEKCEYYLVLQKKPLLLLCPICNRVV